MFYHQEKLAFLAIQFWLFNSLINLSELGTAADIRRTVPAGLSFKQFTTSSSSTEKIKTSLKITFIYFNFKNRLYQLLITVHTPLILPNF